MQSELAAPTNGAGLTTLQQAYNNSPTPGAQILLDAVPNPVAVRASVAGDVFLVQDLGGNNILQVTADPDLVTVRSQLLIEDPFLNSNAVTAIIADDSATYTAPYIGGTLQSIGTQRASAGAGTFIVGTFAEQKRYEFAVNPGFAAYTVMNVLPQIANVGNFNLFPALAMNVGVAHRRESAGTSNTANTIGLSFAASTQATVAGAIMTKTFGDRGVQFAPKFSTVAGSTANLGTMIGLECAQPAAGLFQPSAGAENMTAYYGMLFPNFTFGGASAVVNVINSALNSGTNKRFLNHTGTAESTHAGNLNMLADFPNGIIRQGASSDYSQGYVGPSNELFCQIITPAVTQWRYSAPATGRLLLSGAGVTLGELNINTNRFSLGASSGANGNVVGNFVTPARTIVVGGDWSDFLLTQAGSLTVNGLAMGRVAAWVINPVSYANSTGSVGNADTLTVGGFPTSSPGVTITERQSLHVIGGRSRHQAVMQFDPINPAALASGNNNDWAGLLTGSANNSMRHWARIQGNATTSVLTGIDATAVQDGDTFELTNVSANAIDISHQDAASAAANRIISPTGATYVLAADETVLVRYDLATTRWRLMGGTGA